MADFTDQLPQQPEHIPLLERPVTRRALLLASMAGALATAACERSDHPEPIKDCGELPESAERHEVRTGSASLNHYNWHIAGAEHQPDGSIILAPLPAETVPINLYGAVLQPQGDFTVGASVELGHDAIFAMHLKESPTLSFNGYIQSPSSVKVECHESGGKVVVWQNEHDKPRAYGFTLEKPGAGQQVFVERKDGHVFVHVGGQQVAGPLPDTFTTGNVWLGLATKEGASTVRSLAAGAAGGDTLNIVDTTTMEIPPCPTGLAEHVHAKTGGRLAMGTSLKLAPFVSDKKYASLAIGEFQSHTTENAGKMAFLQPLEGVFTFGDLDALTDIAARHKKDIWLHTLVWHRELPGWAENLPPSRAQDVMTRHIRTVLGHTRGKVKGVDAVNEPLANYNGQWRDSVWLRGMGPDYIALALQTANQTDPNAELWINEYGWDKNGPKDEERFQALFTLAKNLKARRIRLDGIGLQGHVLASPRDSADIATLKRRMDAFASIGVKVRISEIDVTPDAGRDSQAKQFSDMLRLAIEQPNCTGYTIWGIGGPYVSGASADKLAFRTSTPWDEKLEPTQIYAGLQKTAA